MCMLKLYQVIFKHRRHKISVSDQFDLMRSEELKKRMKFLPDKLTENACNTLPVCDHLQVTGQL